MLAAFAACARGSAVDLDVALVKRDKRDRRAARGRRVAVELTRFSDAGFPGGEISAVGSLYKDAVERKKEREAEFHGSALEEESVATMKYEV